MALTQGEEKRLADVEQRVDELDAWASERDRERTSPAIADDGLQAVAHVLEFLLDNAFGANVRPDGVYPPEPESEEDDDTEEATDTDANVDGKS